MINQKLTARGVNVLIYYVYALRSDMKLAETYVAEDCWAFGHEKVSTVADADGV